MKFEIDDKTGMIYNADRTSSNEMIPITIENLELIWKALSKTHTKLSNQKIQKIQDSKKELS